MASVPSSPPKTPDVATPRPPASDDDGGEGKQEIRLGADEMAAQLGCPRPEMALVVDGFNLLFRPMFGGLELTAMLANSIPVVGWQSQKAARGFTMTEFLGVSDEVKIYTKNDDSATLFMEFDLGNRHFEYELRQLAIESAARFALLWQEQRIGAALALATKALVLDDVRTSIDVLARACAKAVDRQKPSGSKPQTPSSAQDNTKAPPAAAESSVGSAPPSPAAAAPSVQV